MNSGLVMSRFLPLRPLVGALSARPRHRLAKESIPPARRSPKIVRDGWMALADSAMSRRWRRSEPMRHATLGPLGQVSRLTLGGGGIGQIWGEVSAEEAKATLPRRSTAASTCSTPRPAIATARPSSARCSTGGCRPGSKSPPSTAWARSRSGEAAERLADVARRPAWRLCACQRVDLFFLHTNIRRDGFVYAHGADRQAQVATA